MNLRLVILCVFLAAVRVNCFDYQCGTVWFCSSHEYSLQFPVSSSVDDAYFVNAVEQGIFSDLTSQKSIYINNAPSLTSLPANLFLKVGATITRIGIAHNPLLTTIPTDLLAPLSSSLTELVIANNVMLQNLPDNLFGVGEKLDYFQANRMPLMHAMPNFASFPNLRIFDWKGPSNVTHFPEHIFTNKSKLERINVQQHPTLVVKGDLFNGLDALTELDLSGTDLSHVSDTMLCETCLQKLQILKLSPNLKPGVRFNSLPSLRSAWLESDAVWNDVEASAFAKSSSLYSLRYHLDIPIERFPENLFLGVGNSLDHVSISNKLWPRGILPASLFVGFNMDRIYSLDFSPYQVAYIPLVGDDKPILPNATDDVLSYSPVIPAYGEIPKRQFVTYNVKHLKALALANQTCNEELVMANAESTASQGGLTQCIKKLNDYKDQCVGSSNRVLDACCDTASTSTASCLSSSAFFRPLFVVVALTVVIAV